MVVETCEPILEIGTNLLTAIALIAFCYLLKTQHTLKDS